MNLIKIFSFCKAYLLNQKLCLTIFMVFNLAVTATSLVFPYISGNFIDALLASNDTAFIFDYALILSSFGVISITFDFIVEKTYTTLQTRASYKLNSDVVKYVQRLPITFLQKQNSAYLNQMIHHDSNALIAFILGVLRSFIANLVLIILPLSVIFILDSMVVLIVLVSLLLYYTGYALFKRLIYQANFQFKESHANFFSKLYEQLEDISFIKMHGLVPKFILRLDSKFNDLLLKTLRLQIVNYSYSSYEKLLSILAQIALMFICGARIVSGELTIGEFTIILAYFTTVKNAMRYYFTLGQSIQSSLVSYTRLKDLLILETETEGDIVLDAINKIELKNATFAFGVNKVINERNIVFEKGRMYAILGPNGAGKSTLMRLIVGLFMDEFEGEILYNGKSIKTLKMSAVLSKNIAISEQEPFLLSDTVKYNLTLDEEVAIDDEELNKLINLLGLNNFFSSLAKGVNSLISEKSSNLSGGEKQKLSLLRVLLKDADVLILDEPTSALDELGKNSLINYLAQLKNDKIIIAVTHDNHFAEHFDEQISI